MHSLLQVYRMSAPTNRIRARNLDRRDALDLGRVQHIGKSNVDVLASATDKPIGLSHQRIEHVPGPGRRVFPNAAAASAFRRRHPVELHTRNATPLRIAGLSRPSLRLDSGS